ncbi:MAG: hypothetical protein WC136_00940 [Sphaerochaeta sp.]|nr:hypothetical protein [Sphaerochaeta sp.]
MLLDATTLKKIDSLTWHSLPDVSDGVLPDEVWKCGDLVCTILKNPRCKSGEDLVYIPYAIGVKRGTSLVLVVSLEQEDLRSLSLKLGCSLRELQEDYSTKSNFGELRAYIYTKEEREDLGLYEGKLDMHSVRLFLLDTVCDTLDIVSAPEQIKE